jgi:hypothetical protein
MAELVLVDNNPLSVQDPILYSFEAQSKIIRSDASVVGGVRNAGVRSLTVRTEYLAFVDCDCEVKPSFCSDVLAAFARSESTVVGCRVVSPIDGHWTEVASDALHRAHGDGPRDFLNSGCLAVRSDIFLSLGGFSEVLPANEDYDFCERVRANGGSITQFEALQVVHLGNPQSVAGFMERLIWHGKGAVRSDGRLDYSAMLVATFFNSTAIVTGISSALLLAWHERYSSALATLSVSLAAVPIAFWLLRIVQFRRWIPPFSSVALMQLTFVSRQVGLILRLIEIRRARDRA